MKGSGCGARVRVRVGVRVRVRAVALLKGLDRRAVLVVRAHLVGVRVTVRVSLT